MSLPSSIKDNLVTTDSIDPGNYFLGIVDGIAGGIGLIYNINGFSRSIIQFQGFSLRLPSRKVLTINFVGEAIAHPTNGRKGGVTFIHGCYLIGSGLNK